MTPGEFKAYAETMKEFGISHFKMGDVEISWEPIRTQKKLTPRSPQIQNTDAGADLPEGISLDAEDPIKHNIEELTSLLKLDDKDLVDRLFPEPQSESA